MTTILRKYRKTCTNGITRLYGVFLCDTCSVEFETRYERINVMTGMCNTCSNKANGKNKTVHGFSGKNDRLYGIWGNMKRRCLNPTEKEKRNYSGISVCEEWLSFIGFKEWADKNRYSDNVTLDRIDNSKGYHPYNCRFVDNCVQSANRRKTDKNKSGYIGVSKHGHSWRALVQWRGVRHSIGSFADKLDAAIARDEYIKENNLPHTLSTPERN